LCHPTGCDTTGYQQLIAAYVGNWWDKFFFSAQLTVAERQPVVWKK